MTWENDQVVEVGPAERGKIVAFLGEGSIGVTCGATREEADAWLARYPEDARVMPYLGRSGWNTLVVGGRIPDEEVRESLSRREALVRCGSPERP